MPDQKAVVVGISGASSSGKTTLARLLRDIFPHTFILHEDDFYKPETELPSKEGLLDWDSADSIDIPDMAKALAYIREHGTFPVSELDYHHHHPTASRTDHGRAPPSGLRRQDSTPSSSSASPNPVPPRPRFPTTDPRNLSVQPFVDSKEDQNSVGQCPVSDAKIAEMRARVEAWMQPGQAGHAVLEKARGADGEKLKVCLLDGFLLFSAEMRAVMEVMDIKMFLLVSRARATQRREARDGYVTLEGFWKDPPGYVDKIVWPNYVEAHKWLFEDGDVEGNLKTDVLDEYGIRAQVGKGVDIDMETTFEWAVDTLLQELETFQ